MGLTSSGLIDQLRIEGYRLTPGYLNYLLREHPVLRPDSRAGSFFLWEPADIDRLRAALKERGRGPTPHVGQALPPHKNGGQP